MPLKVFIMKQTQKKVEKRKYFCGKAQFVSHQYIKKSLEHRRRGQKSPDPKLEQVAPKARSSPLWCMHEKLITLSASRAEIPISGCVPNELKQYLDQPLIDRKSDPIEFWINCRHFTPVLSEIALKYLICQASYHRKGLLQL